MPTLGYDRSAVCYYDSCETFLLARNYMYLQLELTRAAVGILV